MGTLLKIIIRRGRALFTIVALPRLFNLGNNISLPYPTLRWTVS